MGKIQITDLAEAGVHLVTKPDVGIQKCFRIYTPSMIGFIY